MPATLTRKEYEKITFSTPTPNVQRASPSITRQEYEKSLQPVQVAHGPGDEFLRTVRPEKPPQKQDPGIYGAFDVWAAPPDSEIWKGPGAEFTGEFGAGYLEQTRIPALAGKKFAPPKTMAGKIGRAAGQMTEAIEELVLLKGALQGMGVLTKAKDIPKGATALEKAFQVGGLFFAQELTDEARKRTAEAIYDEDFGSRGGMGLIEAFQIGATLSLAGSGIKGAWNKLKPNEQAKMLKTLGLKKGASLREINRAARIQARKFHPDKVGGMRESFDKVINARDALRKMKAGDIIKRGGKKNFVNNVQQQMGVSKDVAENALKRLEAGESIEKVDQMLSQAKFGIKPLVTAPAGKEAVSGVSGKFASGETVEVTIDGGKTWLKRKVASGVNPLTKKPIDPVVEIGGSAFADNNPRTMVNIKGQGGTTDSFEIGNVRKLTPKAEIEAPVTEKAPSEAVVEKPVAKVKAENIARTKRKVLGRNLSKAQAEELAQKTGGEIEGFGNNYTVRQPTAKAQKVEAPKEIKDVEKETITEPPESPKVVKKAKLSPKQGFASYKENMPNATEKEVVVAMAEDGIKPPSEMIEKYKDVPVIQNYIGKAKIDKAVKLPEKTVAAKIPTRPLVNPKASALQQDKQLKKQQLWDRKYGKPTSRQGGFLTLPRTPTPEALREGAEKIYQDAINRFASIENVTKKAQKLGMEIKPGENPGLRARSYLGLGRKVESVLIDKTYKITPEGNIEITGEGLKPILDDYDTAGKAFEPKRGKRKVDFKTYLESQRTILDLQRPAAEWKTTNIVSNAQVQKAKIDLERLKKKYGIEGTKNLEDSAQRLYGFQKRVLHTLVDGGNLSQKQYDDIVSKNQHYIPFDRVLGDEIKGGVPVSKGRFTKARAPVRKIKGSEKEIQDPIESIIKNTFRIMEAADRNTVARNVAKLGKALPDDIRPIRVKMFPIKVDPKEILTVSREFRTQSSKVIQEYRDIKTEGGKGADVSGPIKKLEKVVTDALTHRGFSKGEANSFLNQIRKGEAAEVSDVTIETIRQIIRDTQKIIITEEPIESTIFRPSQFAPKGKVIEYFDKGKRKYIEVSPNLHEAMTGLNEEGSSLLVRALSLPAHWLRIGATSTPEFIVRNPIRDQWTALMQTSFGFVPFYDSMGAIADILDKTDVYHDWLRSGGAYSGFVELNRPALKKAAKQLTSTKTRRMLGRLNILSDAQDVAQLMEQATRVGMFKKAEKAGLSAIEAGFESREGTIDFQRRGAKMRDVNSMVAFFNAGVQGIDKTIRISGKHPVSTAVKGFMAITLPSILLYLHNRKSEGYKELPRWRKDLFWIYMTEGGTPIHIIKPFFYGQLFGSLPERLMEYIDTKDPKAFRDFEKTVLESLTPISGEPEGTLLPTALKPIIENWGNRSFFLERPVVPEGKKDLDPEFQYSRYTSESAKHLGRWLNYSPAKIENLIRGYTGGSGRYGLQATDELVNAIKKASGQPMPPKRPRESADIPLVKGFVGRSPTGPQAQSIQDFYDDSQKVISAYDTYRRMYGDIIARKQQQDTLIKLRKRRPLSTAEKQALKPLTSQEKLDFAKSEKYRQANPNLLLGPTMKTTRTLLTKLGKQADVIVKMEISDKEKRLRLKRIDSTRLKVAQEANKKLK